MPDEKYLNVKHLANVRGKIITELQVALDKYGRHLDNCFLHSYPHMHPRNCSCGLTKIRR